MIEKIRCLIRWHLTAEERKQIADGADVYLFYDPNLDTYSLQLSPEGTETPETESQLLD